MSYRAWLVDLDGTLYRARWVKLAMAAELALSGLGVVKTLRRFRHEHELLRDDMKEDAADPFRLQVERTAATLGKDPEVVERQVRDWMVRRPLKWITKAKNRSLLEEIRAFRDGGGHTALVSDYPARDKLAALGANGLFDVVVANGEPDGPQRLKPHPGGYLEAARRLGVAPEECLVIGDRDDADGAAARAAGMGFRHV